MNIEARSKASLRDFLHVVFKRKTQILIFFGLTFITVAIGTLVMEPTYEATSQILVKMGRENLYVPTVPSRNNLSPVVSFDREEQINSEIEILKGRFLAQKVVESLGAAAIYKDAKESGRGLLSALFRRPPVPQAAVEKATLKLQEALGVEGVRKSDVIEVSFEHQDPQMAAVVVNTLVKFYLDHHVDVHKTPQSYGFFQEQSQILKDKLNGAEQKLKAFKKNHAISSLEEERSLLLRQEADLSTDLNQTVSHEAETQNRIAQLRQQLANTAQIIPLDEEVDHNPLAISALQGRLVELELKEQGLLGKYTEQSRLVQNVREEIQMVREKLADQENRRYGKTRSGVNTTYQRLQEQFLQNEAELKALRGKKETQMAQLGEEHLKLEELNRIEVQLKQLQEDVEVNRQNYRLYQSKFEESRISDAMDAEKIANVAVIQRATAPSKPVSPRVLLNMVLAIFLGGFGGLGLAFFLEYLDDSLEKDEDVETYLELPALGSVPDMIDEQPMRCTSTRRRWLKAKLALPRFAFNTSVVLPVGCILFMLLLLATWRPGRQAQTAVQGPMKALPETPLETKTNKANLSSAVESAAFAQLTIVPRVSIQKKEDEKTEEAPPVKEDVGNKPLRVTAPVPEENTAVSKAGEVQIQLGAFRKRESAERLMRQLQGKGYDAYVEADTLKRLGLLHLVRVRGYASVSSAERAMAQLAQLGLRDAFVVD
jgi:uncharacterized protein involved in exopolysaccharide biosynthesis